MDVNTFIYFFLSNEFLSLFKWEGVTPADGSGRLVIYCHSIYDWKEMRRSSPSSKHKSFPYLLQHLML